MVDKSAVSRMLAGQRKMKIGEADGIASYLGVPVSEVLVHAGVQVGGDATAPATHEMVLAATIDERGIVEELAEHKPLPQAVVDRARTTLNVQGTQPIIGAQIRAITGPLSVMDDAVVLYHYYADGVDPAAIGFLSICRLKDGVQFLAKIERARKTGEARVTCATGEVKDVALDAATPVLAVIP
jgi:hypothetical protein